MIIQFNKGGQEVQTLLSRSVKTSPHYAESKVLDCLPVFVLGLVRMTTKCAVVFGSSVGSETSLRGMGQSTEAISFSLKKWRGCWQCRLSSSVWTSRRSTLGRKQGVHYVLLEFPSLSFVLPGRAERHLRKRIRRALRLCAFADSTASAAPS